MGIINKKRIPTFEGFTQKKKNSKVKEKLEDLIFFLGDLLRSESTILDEMDQDMLKDVGKELGSKDIIALSEFETLDDTDIELLQDALQELKDKANS